MEVQLGHLRGWPLIGELSPGKFKYAYFIRSEMNGVRLFF